MVRTQEAKVIEEKAAKIKDWVTVKLREVSSDAPSRSPDELKGEKVPRSKLSSFRADGRLKFLRKCQVCF